MIHKERIVNKELKIKLDKSFLCYYCKAELLPFLAKLQEFELREGMDMSHALDVFYICPECGLQQIFGKAVPKEQFEKIKPFSKEVKTPQKVASNK